MEGYLAQVLLFAGNFAPRNWAFCEGQLLPISQNQALFSLLGTTYGGDGRTSFALPDLRGRVPIGPRRGAGLSNYTLGQKGGVETVTLQQNQMPSHNHVMTASSGAPTHNTASGSSLASANRSVDMDNIYADGAANVSMGSETGNAGGNLDHENRPPFIALNYIICLAGIFPSRS